MRGDIVKEHVTIPKEKFKEALEALEEGACCPSVCDCHNTDLDAFNTSICRKCWHNYLLGEVE